ncbi:MAG: tyrosine-type recombinase/integrase [Rhodoferax sp.]
MFETLVRTKPALARYRDGPLAAERDRYLRHCADQGGTQESMRLRARSILWFAERMSPDDFGQVDAARLHNIVYGAGSPAAPAPAPSTAATLVANVRPWLKYLGWWCAPEASIPFAPVLERFVTWMRDERGLTQCTVDQWQYRTAKFLCWCADTGRDLAALQPQDIDAYFVTYGAQRWSRTSAGHVAKMLRVFLRHAASTGACSATLAGSIVGPRRYALESLPYALSWDDVRRVIATASSDTERDIRDRAILLLLAVYGLRRGEVAALRLDQIDRARGQLNIWRLKRRQPQVYPLVPTVARALARYVDEVRPRVAHAEVFIRLQAPRIPISAPCLYNIVSRRLCYLGIQAAHLGPHALRHSCATKLLADGLTLKEIGDHLGHRSTSATMTYTKVDMNSLRQVGEFDLGGLQ